MKNRIDWLDSLKGVAIILVVIRHVMQSNIINCSETFLGNVIFAVQMPIFMIIAGFFCVTSELYYRDFSSTCLYIKKRAVHYMLPFFSGFIIVCVLIRGFYDRNIITGLGVLVNNVDVGLWFLYVVFILSVDIIVAKKICSKMKKFCFVPILVGGALLLPLLVIVKLFGARFLGINLILYYYVYFAIGNLLYVYRNTIKRICEKRLFLLLIFSASLVLFLIIVCTHNIELSDDSLSNITMRVVAALTGSTVIAIIVYELSRIKKKDSLPLAIIGKYTLEIYVVHVHYIGILPKGQHYFYTIDGLTTFVVAIAITAILTCITIMVIEHIPILNKIFFGK